MPNEQMVRIEGFKGMRVQRLRDSGSPDVVAPPLLAKVRNAAPQHLVAKADDARDPDTYFLSIIHDDPRETPNARVDVCVGTSSHEELNDTGLGSYELPGGLHAVYRHVGSRNGLRQAWEEFASMKSDEYKLREGAPRFEIYLNDSTNTPEDQLITDLYVPVEAIIKD